jgi:carbonic anhydrase/acetyltransferase-like protein (isoleucine patch superfamily)
LGFQRPLAGVKARADIALAPLHVATERSMAIYELHGRSPQFPADGQCYIAGSAEVIGNVRLGSNTSIWFGAVLRGDNELIDIGDNSNVQDNCTFHTDPGFPLSIGKNCTIGHGVILHGCTIGDGTLIGMGAIVMNGARIGNRCVVGAGAVIAEGKTFGDHSLVVGLPAKAIRTLAADQLATMLGGAHRYVENGRRFNAGLRRIG